MKMKIDEQRIFEHTPGFFDSILLITGFGPMFGIYDSLDDFIKNTEDSVIVQPRIFEKKSSDPNFEIRIHHYANPDPELMLRQVSSYYEVLRLCPKADVYEWSKDEAILQLGEVGIKRLDLIRDTYHRPASLDMSFFGEKKDE